MNEAEFDKALSDFLDDEKCEKANESVYSLIRSAFTAGWEAALGSDLGKLMKIGERDAALAEDVPYEDPGRDRPL